MSIEENIKILIVDDEPMNLKILRSDLSTTDYQIIEAETGSEALNRLDEDKDIALVILDRMMPGMSGMDVLHSMKSDPRLKGVPVILQTAASSAEEVAEGIAAGAFYYLVKPFKKEILLSIVRSALEDSSNKKKLIRELNENKVTLGLMKSSSFEFRTLNEARNLSYLLAHCFPDPESVIMGISELLINAVEHGNLAITYDEKTDLIKEGRWEEEIESRLADSKYSNRVAKIDFSRDESNLIITVEDKGDGFDWKKYSEISPEMLETSSHGRGIALSKILSFSTLEYIGKGNKVKATVKLSE